MLREQIIQEWNNLKEIIQATQFSPQERELIAEELFLGTRASTRQIIEQIRRLKDHCGGGGDGPQIEEVD